MKYNPLVSIIIRTKNEERWIGHCLRAVFNQSYNNFEVILVDNNSSDHTVAKSRGFDVKIITINDFIPGKAINEGIRVSQGDILVCLSGHCVPVNDVWLENLIGDLQRKDVAGVYGRQEPLSFSSDLDKRDLINVFGLDKQVQLKDSFFHNANSAIRRDVWEKFPWDENATNIEDRLWARQVLDAGYKIIYEPDASVYHYHGINQESNIDRARNVVSIMESIEGIDSAKNKTTVDDTKVIAVIPVKGESCSYGAANLLEHTISIIKNSQLISDIIVSTDNVNTAKFATSLGVKAPFIRPSSLSSEYVGINEVLRWTINEIESSGDVQDLVLLVEETYPFRHAGMIDEMVGKVINEGLDTVVACHEETRRIWLSNEYGKTIDISDGNFIPRKFMEHSAYVGLVGLGCITHAEFIRSGEVFGPKLGIYDIHDPLSSIEVRDKDTLAMLENIVATWGHNNGK